MKRVDISQKKTSLKVNNSIEGETIETKVERVVTQKEPIEDEAPLIYTEREEGVLPSYDIRTDRFDAAIDAMDMVSKSVTAKRLHKLEEKKNIVVEEPNKPTETTE